jgi:hypothetical protein
LRFEAALIGGLVISGGGLPHCGDHAANATGSIKIGSSFGARDEFTRCDTGILFRLGARSSGESAMSDQVGEPSTVWDQQRSIFRPRPAR